MKKMLKVTNNQGNTDRKYTYLLRSVRTAIIKKTSVGKDVEKRKPVCI